MIIRKNLCIICLLIVLCSTVSAAKTGTQAPDIPGSISFEVTFNKQGSNIFYFFDPDESYSDVPAEVREFSFGYYSGLQALDENLTEEIGVYYSINNADSFSIDLDFSSLALGSSGVESSGFMIGHIDDKNTGLNYSVHDGAGEVILDNSEQRDSAIAYEYRHFSVVSSAGSLTGSKEYLLSLPVGNGFASGQYRGYIYMTLTTY